MRISLELQGTVGYYHNIIVANSYLVLTVAMNCSRTVAIYLTR